MNVLDSSVKYVICSCRSINCLVDGLSLTPVPTSAILNAPVANALEAAPAAIAAWRRIGSSSLFIAHSDEKKKKYFIVISLLNNYNIFFFNFF